MEISESITIDKTSHRWHTAKHFVGSISKIYIMEMPTTRRHVANIEKINDPIHLGTTASI